jgi:hypothetical protein
MATVFEECPTKEQRSVVLFLWAKSLNAKDSHIEMFPVHGGKCLSRKAFHNLVEKRSKRFAETEEVEREARKWLRRLCCGLRRTGKAMEQLYQCFF